MSNTILFVFEGEKAEPKILQALENYFFKTQSNVIIKAVYGAEIYQLWKDCNEDSDLDLIGLLKERDFKSNNKELSNLRRKDVSEVFLIFDQEAHSHPELLNYPALIVDMVTLFNESTENGKIYINYPMLESFRDYSETPEIPPYVFISENKKYKQLVGSRSDFKDPKKITRNDWLWLFYINIVRANNLLQIKNEDIIDFENYQKLTQLEIAKAQSCLCEEISSRCAVLSGLPFLIIDYCGKNLFGEVMQESFQKKKSGNN